METKKLALWLVVIFVAGAVISGIFLLTSGLPRSIRNGEEWPPLHQGDGKDVVIDESREFPAGGIEELDIELRFENVVISAVRGDVITLRYHGTVRPSRKVDDLKKIFFTEQSGTLLTVDSRWGNIPINNHHITLEVGIPSGTLEKLTFYGASGNHEISGLNLDSLDVRGASGRIAVRDISAETALVKASSGSVTAENWKVGSGRIESSSGNLKLEEISAAGNLELKLSSGSLNAVDIEAAVIEGRISSGRTVLKGISGSLELKSSSGSVDVEFRNPGNSININVTSGGIDVGLPAGTEFMLDARASSGTIRSDFAVMISGSMAKNSLQGVTGISGTGGGRSVELKCSSGKIVLREIAAD